MNRFTSLPPELILLTITFAARPETPSSNPWERPLYNTALSLARVSRDMYHLTMPHLLHTVAVDTQTQLHLFLTFIEGRLLRHGSRNLAFDYLAQMKRFLATDRCEVWEPALPINAQALYAVLRRVECIGLSFHMFHLLYNTIDAFSGRNWACEKLILSGTLPRWHPLTMSPGGLDFLQNITHLALWIPFHGTTEEGVRDGDGRVLPKMSGVPFDQMKRLEVCVVPLLNSVTGYYEEMATLKGKYVFSTGPDAVRTRFLQQIPADKNGEIWNCGFWQEEVEAAWGKEKYRKGT